MFFKFLVILWNCGLTFWAILLLLLKGKENLLSVSVGVLLILALVCFAVNSACLAYHLSSAYHKYKRHLRHKRGEVTDPGIQKTMPLQAETRTVTVPIKR